MLKTLPKPKPGQSFALYMVEEGDPTRNGWGDYYHLQAHTAVIHLDSQEDCAHTCELGGVRYGDFTECRAVDQALSHLLVNSQGNCADKTRSLYAWDVELRDLFALDLRQAEAAVMVLRTVKRRMQKEAERLGPPQTFGLYVASAARALNCAHILFQPFGKAEGYSNGRKREWADGYNYHARTPGEAVSRIDGIVWDFVHALEVDEVTA